MHKATIPQCTCNVQCCLMFETTIVFVADALMWGAEGKWLTGNALMVRIHCGDCPMAVDYKEYGK